MDWIRKSGVEGWTMTRFKIGFDMMNSRIFRALIMCTAVFLLADAAPAPGFSPTHRMGRSNAPAHGFSPSHRMGRSNGCFHENELVENGAKIENKESCLNCTCKNNMVMCYVQVCPFVKPLGEECITEKTDGDCCPKFWCPDTVKEKDGSPIEGHPGCYLEDKYYPDGARLPQDPKNPCEVCYCIRNSTSCIMQECELKIEGCSPVYKDNQCCPGRYNCTYEEVTTLPPGYTVEDLSEGCYLEDGTFVADGESLKSVNPCDHCYCMRNEMVCVVQDCKAPGENCVPLPKEPGQCCPEKYDCANHNETKTPSLVTGENVTFSTVFDLSDAETKPSTIIPDNDASHIQSNSSSVEYDSHGAKGLPKKDTQAEKSSFDGTQGHVEVSETVTPMEVNNDKHLPSTDLPASIAYEESSYPTRDPLKKVTIIDFEGNSQFVPPVKGFSIKGGSKFPIVSLSTKGDKTEVQQPSSTLFPEFPKFPHQSTSASIEDVYSKHERFSTKPPLLIIENVHRDEVSGKDITPFSIKHVGIKGKSPIVTISSTTPVSTFATGTSEEDIETSSSYGTKSTESTDINKDTLLPEQSTDSHGLDESTSVIEDKSTFTVDVTKHETSHEPDHNQAAKNNQPKAQSEETTHSHDLEHTIDPFESVDDIIPVPEQNKTTKETFDDLSSDANIDIEDLETVTSKSVIESSLNVHVHDDKVSSFPEKNQTTEGVSNVLLSASAIDTLDNETTTLKSDFESGLNVHVHDDGVSPVSEQNPTTGGMFNALASTTTIDMLDKETSTLKSDKGNDIKIDVHDEGFPPVPEKDQTIDGVFDEPVTEAAINKLDLETTTSESDIENVINVDVHGDKISSVPEQIQTSHELFNVLESEAAVDTLDNETTISKSDIESSLHVDVHDEGVPPVPEKDQTVDGVLKEPVTEAAINKLDQETTISESDSENVLNVHGDGVSLVPEQNQTTHGIFNVLESEATTDKPDLESTTSKSNTESSLNANVHNRISTIPEQRQPTDGVFNDLATESALNKLYHETTTSKSDVESGLILDIHNQEVSYGSEKEEPSIIKEISSPEEALKEPEIDMTLVKNDAETILNVNDTAEMFSEEPEHDEALDIYKHILPTTQDTTEHDFDATTLLSLDENILADKVHDETSTPTKNSEEDDKITPENFADIAKGTTSLDVIDEKRIEESQEVSSDLENVTQVDEKHIEEPQVVSTDLENVTQIDEKHTEEPQEVSSDLANVTPIDEMSTSKHNEDESSGLKTIVETITDGTVTTSVHLSELEESTTVKPLNEEESSTATTGKHISETVESSTMNLLNKDEILPVTTTEHLSETYESSSVKPFDEEEISTDHFHKSNVDLAGSQIHTKFHIKGKPNLLGEQRWSTWGSSTTQPGKLPRPIVMPIPGEGICRVDNRIYNNLEKVPSRNVCERNCQCVNSKILCDEIICGEAPLGLPENCQLVHSESQCCPSLQCDEINYYKPTTPAAPTFDDKVYSQSTPSFTDSSIVSENLENSELETSIKDIVDDTASKTNVQDFETKISEMPVSTFPPTVITEENKTVTSDFGKDEQSHKKDMDLNTEVMFSTHKISTFDIDASTLKPEESTLKAEDSTLKPEETFLKPETSSLEPEVSSTELEADSLVPEVSSLIPEELSLESSSSSLKPEIFSSEPEVSSLKPEISLEAEATTSEPEVSSFETKASSLEPNASFEEHEASAFEPEASTYNQDQNVDISKAFSHSPVTSTYMPTIPSHDLKITSLGQEETPYYPEITAQEHHLSKNTEIREETSSKPDDSFMFSETPVNDSPENHTLEAETPSSGHEHLDNNSVDSEISSSLPETHTDIPSQLNSITSDESHEIKTQSADLDKFSQSPETSTDITHSSSQYPEKNSFSTDLTHPQPENLFSDIYEPQDAKLPERAIFEPEVTSHFPELFLNDSQEIYTKDIKTSYLEHGLASHEPNTHSDGLEVIPNLPETSTGGFHVSTFNEEEIPNSPDQSLQQPEDNFQNIHPSQSTNLYEDVSFVPEMTTGFHELALNDTQETSNLTPKVTPPKPEESEEHSINLEHSAIPEVSTDRHQTSSEETSEYPVVTSSHPEEVMQDVSLSSHTKVSDETSLESETSTLFPEFPMSDSQISLTSTDEELLPSDLKFPDFPVSFKEPGKTDYETKGTFDETPEYSTLAENPETHLSPQPEIPIKSFEDSSTKPEELDTSHQSELSSTISEETSQATEVISSDLKKDATEFDTSTVVSTVSSEISSEIPSQDSPDSGIVKAVESVSTTQISETVSHGLEQPTVFSKDFTQESISSNLPSENDFLSNETNSVSEETMLNELKKESISLTPENSTHTFWNTFYNDKSSTHPQIEDKFEISTQPAEVLTNGSEDIENNFFTHAPENLVDEAKLVTSKPEIAPTVFSHAFDYVTNNVKYDKSSVASDLKPFTEAPMLNEDDSAQDKGTVETIDTTANVQKEGTSTEATKFENDENMTSVDAESFVSKDEDKLLIDNDPAIDDESDKATFSQDKTEIVDDTGNAASYNEENYITDIPAKTVSFNDQKDITEEPEKIAPFDEKDKFSDESENTGSSNDDENDVIGETGVSASSNDQKDITDGIENIASINEENKMAEESENTVSSNDENDVIDETEVSTSSNDEIDVIDETKVSASSNDEQKVTDELEETASNDEMEVSAEVENATSDDEKKYSTDERVKTDSSDGEEITNEHEKVADSDDETKNTDESEKDSTSHEHVTEITNERHNTDTSYDKKITEDEKEATISLEDLGSTSKIDDISHDVESSTVSTHIITSPSQHETTTDKTGISNSIANIENILNKTTDTDGDEITASVVPHNIIPEKHAVTLSESEPTYLTQEEYQTSDFDEDLKTTLTFGKIPSTFHNFEPELVDSDFGLNLNKDKELVKPNKVSNTEEFHPVYDENSTSVVVDLKKPSTFDLTDGITVEEGKDVSELPKEAKPDLEKAIATQSSTVLKDDLITQFQQTYTEKSTLTDEKAHPLDNNETTLPFVENKFPEQHDESLNMKDIPSVEYENITPSDESGNPDRDAATISVSENESPTDLLSSTHIDVEQNKTGSEEKYLTQQGVSYSTMPQETYTDQQDSKFSTTHHENVPTFEQKDLYFSTATHEIEPVTEQKDLYFSTATHENEPEMEQKDLYFTTAAHGKEPASEKDLLFSTATHENQPVVEQKDLYFTTASHEKEPSTEMKDLYFSTATHEKEPASEQKDLLFSTTTHDNEPAIEQKNLYFSTATHNNEPAIEQKDLYFSTAAQENEPVTEQNDLHFPTETTKDALVENTMTSTHFGDEDSDKSQTEHKEEISAAEDISELIPESGHETTHFIAEENPTDETSIEEHLSFHNEYESPAISVDEDKLSHQQNNASSSTMSSSSIIPVYESSSDSSIIDTESKTKYDFDTLVPQEENDKTTDGNLLFSSIAHTDHTIEYDGNINETPENKTGSEEYNPRSTPVEYAIETTMKPEKHTGDGIVQQIEENYDDFSTVKDNESIVKEYNVSKEDGYTKTSKPQFETNDYADDTYTEETHTNEDNSILDKTEESNTHDDKHMETDNEMKTENTIDTADNKYEINTPTETVMSITDDDSKNDVIELLQEPEKNKVKNDSSIIELDETSIYSMSQAPTDNSSTLSPISNDKFTESPISSIVTEYSVQNFVKKGDNTLLSGLIPENLILDSEQSKSPGSFYSEISDENSLSKGKANKTALFEIIQGPTVVSELSTDYTTEESITKRTHEITQNEESKVTEMAVENETDGVKYESEQPIDLNENNLSESTDDSVDKTIFNTKENVPKDVDVSLKTGEKTEPPFETPVSVETESVSEEIEHVNELLSNFPTQSSVGSNNLTINTDLNTENAVTTSLPFEDSDLKHTSQFEVDYDFPSNTHSINEGDLNMVFSNPIMQIQFDKAPNDSHATDNDKPLGGEPNKTLSGEHIVETTNPFKDLYETMHTIMFMNDTKPENKSEVSTKLETGLKSSSFDEELVPEGQEGSQNSLTPTHTEDSTATKPTVSITSEILPSESSVIDELPTKISDETIYNVDHSTSHTTQNTLEISSVSVDDTSSAETFDRDFHSHVTTEIVEDVKPEVTTKNEAPMDESADFEISNHRRQPAVDFTFSPQSNESASETLESSLSTIVSEHETTAAPHTLSPGFPAEDIWNIIRDHDMHTNETEIIEINPLPTEMNLTELAESVIYTTKKPMFQTTDVGSAYFETSFSPALETTKQDHSDYPDDEQEDLRKPLVFDVKLEEGSVDKVHADSNNKENNDDSASKLSALEFLSLHNISITTDELIKVLTTLYPTHRHTGTLTDSGTLIKSQGHGDRSGVEYCLYEEKKFNSAQQIPRKDSCEFCFCFRGDIICLQQSCPPPIEGCYPTPIEGYCCPRFQCPVMVMPVIPVNETRIPKIMARKIMDTGCKVKGKVYHINQVVHDASGPCLICRCEVGGVMKCEPRDCHPHGVPKELIMHMSGDLSRKLR